MQSDLDRLIAFYRPLAVALAGRQARGDRREDLEQVACLGLVKAAKRFDPTRGTGFRSYAIPMILGEMKRFWRDTSWALHVPRPVQERSQAIRQLVGDAAREGARPPTARSLAIQLSCSEEDVVEALFAGTSAKALSLDGGPAGDEGVALAEQVGGDDPTYEYVDCIESIKRALPKLTSAEREVVRLRFAGDLSHREIGQALGISPRRVSVLLADALERLAQMMSPVVAE